MQKVRLSAFGKMFGDHMVDDGPLPESITLEHSSMLSSNTIWGKFDYVCRSISGEPVYTLTNMSKYYFDELEAEERRIKLRKKCIQ